MAGAATGSAGKTGWVEVGMEVARAGWRAAAGLAAAVCSEAAGKAAASGATREAEETGIGHARRNPRSPTRRECTQRTEIPRRHRHNIRLTKTGSSRRTPVSGWPAEEGLGGRIWAKLGGFGAEVARAGCEGSQ